MKCGVLHLITFIFVTYVQKDFKIQILIKQVLTKNIFSWNCPKFDILIKGFFFFFLQYLERDKPAPSA